MTVICNKSNFAKFSYKPIPTLEELQFEKPILKILIFLQVHLEVKNSSKNLKKY